MKERPILFSAPMVRAILEGRKTQTRRVVKEPRWAEPGGLDMYYDDRLCAIAKVSGCLADVECLYGKPGDRLWVRETFLDFKTKIYSSAGMTEAPAQAVYKADGGTLLNGAKWKPSIHMPRWASRILLEVTETRVQRLLEITESDAMAEGAMPWQFGLEQRLTTGERGADSPYRSGFACLWDDINADRATWKSNPWVWAVTFKEVTA